MRTPIAILFLVAVFTSNSLGGDHVWFTRDGTALQLDGKVITEAQNGGILLMDREMVLWAIQPDERTRWESDETPFQPMQAKELAEQMLRRMPSGFRIHSTAHYLVCYNTSPAYAQWCGALYEGLFRAFYNYWTRRGLRLTQPETPLVALVFDKQSSYADYAQSELGSATSNIPAYYSLRTNRVTAFDLTGTQRYRGARNRLVTMAEINRLLAQPGAERTVANIVHEATHQLAYNCGIHQRYADIPLWVSEGLAVFFETPDLQSTTGWRTIGKVNRYRYDQFRKSLSNRPENSIRTLIVGDDRFRQVETALDAYAEAWALTYYLIQRRPDDYIAYLRLMAQKPPMVFDTPEQRLEAFARAFGDDLADLDRQLVRFIQTLR